MKLTRTTLIGSLALLLTGGSLAEVSVQRHDDDKVSTIVIGEVNITDGVDPIPQKIWDKIRDVPVDWILNADGMARGDGRPDIAFLPGKGWPVVVWAYSHGESHDIVIAQWKGTEWSAPEFLTDTMEDELDPRIFIRKDGMVHVVWWVDGGDQHVILAQRSATDVNTPWATVRVSPIGEPSRRPSVAAFGSYVRVAYERDAAAEAFHPAEVVVRKVEAVGSLLEYVGYGEWTEPMDPVLHVKSTGSGDVLWMDWKLGDAVFGYSKLDNGEWADVSTESWNDPTWIGEESVRRAIAAQIEPTASTDPADETGN